MKEIYETPALEMVQFESEDVIMTSVFCQWELPQV